MKACPTCKSIIDADTECPICYTTLTYLPPVDADRERIPLSSYSIRYYGRRDRIAAIALAVLTGFVLCFGASPWFFAGLGFCVLLWIYAHFGRAIDRWEKQLDESLHGSNFRGEQYWAQRRVGNFAILLGAIAVCILVGVLTKV